MSRRRANVPASYAGVVVKASTNRTPPRRSSTGSRAGRAGDPRRVRVPAALVMTDGGRGTAAPAEGASRRRRARGGGRDGAAGPRGSLRCSSGCPSSSLIVRSFLDGSLSRSPARRRSSRARAEPRHDRDQPRSHGRVRAAAGASSSPAGRSAASGSSRPRRPADRAAAVGRRPGAPARVRPPRAAGGAAPGGRDLDIAFTTFAVILAQTFVSAPFFIRSRAPGSRRCRPRPRGRRPRRRRDGAPAVPADHRPARRRGARGRPGHELGAGARRVRRHDHVRGQHRGPDADAAAGRQHRVGGGGAGAPPPPPPPSSFAPLAVRLALRVFHWGRGLDLRSGG